MENNKSFGSHVKTKEKLRKESVQQDILVTVKRIRRFEKRNKPYKHK